MAPLRLPTVLRITPKFLDTDPCSPMESDLYLTHTTVYRLPPGFLNPAALSILLLENTRLVQPQGLGTYCFTYLSCSP